MTSAGPAKGVNCVHETSASRFAVINLHFLIYEIISLYLKFQAVRAASVKVSGPNSSILPTIRPPSKRCNGRLPAKSFSSNWYQISSDIWFARNRPICRLLGILSGRPELFLRTVEFSDRIQRIPGWNFSTWRNGIPIAIRHFFRLFSGG